MKPIIQLGTLPFLLYAAVARGDDECHFYAASGAQVSARSAQCAMVGGSGSAADATKNGLERCKADDGKVLAEFTWKSGKRNGPGFFHDYNDNKLVFQFKDDAANGPGQVFSKEGKLLCETRFVDNKAEGVVREYYASGQLAAALVYRKGERGQPEIRFWPNGKLKSLVCADQSFVPEDRELCGFGGKRKAVQLYDNEGAPTAVVLTYRNGKLEEKKTTDDQRRPVIRKYPTPGNDNEYEAQVLFPSGALFQSYSIKDGRHHGMLREYAENGKLLTETQYQSGEPQSEKAFYLNGNIKHDISRSKEGAITVKKYWDSGKLQHEGTYKIERHYLGFGISSWQELAPIGVIKSYWESGALQEEAGYQDGKREGPYKSYHKNGKLNEDAVYRNDRLASLKRYDEKGKLEVDEEYYEDGSRKLKGAR